MEKKKKVNKQKLEGKEIVNIVDSPGAIVSKNGILDEIVLAMENNPLKTADALAIIKRILDRYHPYYRFVPDFSGDGLPSISIVAKTPEATEKCPLEGTMSVRIPEKYRNFNSMEDLLRYSYERQESISFDDVISFKTFLGDQILDDFDASQHNTMKIRMIPEPFPPPRPYRIEIKGTDLAYNYIELGLSRKVDKVYYLTNEKQMDAPVRFSLTIDLEKEKSNYTIYFDDNIKVSTKKMFKMLQFLHALYVGNIIEVIDIKKDISLFSAASNPRPEMISDLEKEINFYNKLLTLEQTFDVEFELPKSISLETVGTINFLYEVVTTGQYFGESDRYTFTINSKEGLERIRNLVLERPEPIEIMISSPKVNRELFGINISLGNTKFYPPKVKLESLEELESSINHYKEGTSVEVGFVAVKEKTYRQVYDKFTKKKDEW